MDHGLLTVNESGRFLLTTARPVMVFVGRGLRVGTKYSVDSPGIGRSYYYYLSGGDLREQITTISAPNGTSLLKFEGSCGTSVSYTAVVPDQTAIITYTVTAPSRPIVFIQSGETHSGTVISIRELAGGSWEINVLVRYSNRSNIDDVVLYCFAVCPQNVSGYGLALYDQDGAVTYSSGYAPLSIRGLVTVNSISVTGGGISVNYDLSSGFNPGSLSKFAVLSTDWMRGSRVVTGPDFNRALVYGTFSGCFYTGCNRTKKVQQRVVGLGLYYDGAGVRFDAAAMLADTPWVSCTVTGDTANQTVTTVTATAQLPFVVPVIDGSDYDYA
jgi:hypothetical protein